MNIFRKPAGGILVLLSLCFTQFSCADTNTTEHDSEASGLAHHGVEGSSDLLDKGACHQVEGVETIVVYGVPVDVRVPESNYQGDILILHAWGDTRNTWCKKSNLCRKAVDKGYRVIMPNMGNSIYASTVYPETREDWRTYPTMAWLRDSLIPGLQNDYCLLKEKGQNFLLGVSSGARGVIRLAQTYPKLFVAGVALSGDYDPGKLKGDNIYRGFLGDFDLHSDRWLSSENVCTAVDRIQIPLYLGHGREDQVVANTQTQQLYDVLRKSNPHLNIRINIAKGQQHGYGYWNTEIPNVLRFFESIQAQHPAAS